MSTVLYTQFTDNLKNLISCVNRYYKNDTCTKILNDFEKYDMNKILVRYVKLINCFENDIKTKNELIFASNTQVTPFPTLNLNDFWEKFTSAQKNKIFNILNLLIITSKIIITEEKKISANINSKNSKETRVITSKLTTNSSGSGRTKLTIEQLKNKVNNKSQELVDANASTNTTTTTTMTTTNTSSSTSLTFNPYTGIGGGQQDKEFTLTEMYSNMDCLQDLNKSSSFGVGSIAKLLGVNNLLNLDSLADKLNNIKDSDIEEASAKLKQLLGADENSDMSVELDKMFFGLKNDLLNEINIEKNKKNQNPLESVINIAKNFAKTMKAKQESLDDGSGTKKSALDIGVLLKNLSSKLQNENNEKDENGNIIENANSKMMNNIINSLQQNLENKDKDKDNADKPEDVLKNVINSMQNNKEDTNIETGLKGVSNNADTSGDTSDKQTGATQELDPMMKMMSGLLNGLSNNNSGDTSNAGATQDLDPMMKMMSGLLNGMTNNSGDKSDTGAKQDLDPMMKMMSGLLSGMSNNNNNSSNTNNSGNKPDPMMKMMSGLLSGLSNNSSK